MDFCALYKNEKTRERLSNSLRAHTLSHAYILSGKKGSGKHTLALSVAAALNCEQRDGASLPCMRCITCQRIFKGQFTDLKVLSLQGAKASIGVDEVRLMREDMFLSASESEYKAYIFEDADKLTVQAQNALLKVLEEPISKTIIFLLCESPDKLLVTIRSRAPMITMEYLSPDAIDRYLCANSEQAKTLKLSDPEGYREVLMHADGAIGAALEALNPEKMRELRRTYEDVKELLLSFSARTPYASMLSEVSSLPSKRQEFVELMDEVLLAVRDLITYKRCESIEPLLFLNFEDLEMVAGEFNISRLLLIFDLITDAMQKAAQNANMTALTSLLAAKLKYN